jgi:hypothetical protein
MLLSRSAALPIAGVVLLHRDYDDFDLEQVAIRLPQTDQFLTNAILAAKIASLQIQSCSPSHTRILPPPCPTPDVNSSCVEQKANNGAVPRETVTLVIVGNGGAGCGRGICYPARTIQDGVSQLVARAPEIGNASARMARAARPCT